jgi:hypothetical protein
MPMASSLFLAPTYPRPTPSASYTFLASLLYSLLPLCTPGTTIFLETEEHRTFEIEI